MGFSCLFGVRRKTTKPKAPLLAGLFCIQDVFLKVPEEPPLVSFP